MPALVDVLDGLIAALPGERARAKESDGHSGQSPDDDRAETRPLAPSALALVLLIFAAGPVFGAAMGSRDPFGEPGARWLYILFSAVKIPLMIFTTTSICLPGFFVINSLLGLRDGFRTVLHAILASQATLTVALAALAPLLPFLYLSGLSHRGALLASGACFFVATLAAQAVLLSRYRPLIRRTPRYHLSLGLWVAMYITVGIQTGWMLRPFVGGPGAAPSFLRQEPFSNAYVEVVRLIFGP